VVGAVIALYLNVFVLTVQLFEKVPALKALAPTQSEPPFLVAQLVVMALFILFAILAVKRFHPQLVRGA
jgi:flagellar biogenesis protein FliO